jgi:hypothetical protein
MNEFKESKLFHLYLAFILGLLKAFCKQDFLSMVNNYLEILLVILSLFFKLLPEKKKKKI